MARARTRSNSITHQKNTFKLHQNDIQPPFTLTKLGETYFHETIKCRERSTWNDLDIHKAAQLAKCQCDIEDCYQQLNETGWTIEVGTKYGVVLRRHPLCAQLDALQSMQRHLTQLLGLSASQRKVVGDVQAKRNQKDSEIRKLNEDADKNELLA